MKKSNILILLASVSLLFSSCQDMLDTNPTTEVSGSNLNTQEGLSLALNGIYASMYRKTDYLAANNDQCFGYMSLVMAADLMGEDMVQTAKGPGWFWRDYIYENRQRYTSKIWRCYYVWMYLYKIINNANAIIEKQHVASGDANEIKNIVGQAYALRAYSYFMLIQFFQQTYKGHENLPGVPIYTQSTTISSEYKGRGTVEETYNQIKDDLKESLLLLKESTIEQKHKSHLDYYAVSLLQARVALVMNDWTLALSSAEEAIKKPGCTMLSMQEATITKGIYSKSNCVQGSTPFNTVASSDVLWGAEITSTQTTGYRSLYSQMDACTNVYYAAEAPKCISNWLYNQIPDSDVRKGWWNGNINKPASSWGYGPDINYNQWKFQWKNQSAQTGDYVYMRMEEAYLIKAESQCRLSNFDEARKTLMKLGSLRDTNFQSRLDLRTDSNEQTYGSVGTTVTLMDEILLQRRIELWGEVGRIFDIMRLKMNWTRYWSVNGEKSNHTDVLSKYPVYLSIPSDYIECILMIPQDEIDQNPYINEENQNPYNK